MLALKEVVEMTARKRFEFALSPLWRPLLFPIRATEERSVIELDTDELHVSFGVFDYHFPLDAVEDVKLSDWPIWAGVGARTNFRGVVGLVGTYVNVVEITFKEPQRVRMLVRVPCKRLFVSVEDPHEFVAAVRRKLTVEAKAA
jgi:hypothetical protein